MDKTTDLSPGAIHEKSPIRLNEEKSPCKVLNHERTLKEEELKKLEEDMKQKEARAAEAEEKALKAKEQMEEFAKQILAYNIKI